MLVHLLTSFAKSIIMIFQRWASSTHVRIDEQVLVQMKEFASPITVGGVEPMEKQAKELIRIVEKRVRSTTCYICGSV